MNNSIYPCIWFDGNGKDAADFYCNVFADTTISENNGMVIMLNMSGQKFMFLNGGPQYKPNASISFMMMCESEEEVDTYWKKLMEGGIVLMPLDSYPFSKKYGWVRDQFGVTWQLYLGDKGDSKQKFVPTLMYLGEQNGRATEAVELYTKIFPNSNVLGILKYGDSGEDIAEHVQHAQFDIDGYTLMCMDSSIIHDFNFSEGISLVVMTDDQEETDHYWGALIADGGEESMCGWLKDKFGVSWQIIPTRLMELLGHPDREKGQQVMQAMFKMRKIVIADLEKAAA